MSILSSRKVQLLILAGYYTPSQNDSSVILPVLCTFLASKFSADRAVAAIGIGKFGKSVQAILEKALKIEFDPVVKIHIVYSLAKATNQT